MSGSRPGTILAMATMATSPIGMLTRKIQRHPVSSPNAAMISPPSTGPIADDTETVSPNRPKARPRSGPRKSSWMSPEFCGVSRPAAAPCTRRARITSSMFGASPTAALATMKPVRPISIIRRRP